MWKSLTRYKVRAFSLVEMAMVLAVSGVIVGFTIQAYQSSNPSGDCRSTTKAQLQKIAEALDNYPVKNNRMPYPAKRTLGVEDPNYGRESTGGAGLDVAGNFTYGALPFQTLGLPDSYAGDCWGNKFTYVITTQLTNNALMGGYPDQTILGMLHVNSSAGNMIMTNAAYAVISHGADGYGAVKINYSDATNTQRKWCSGSATLEAWNCNLNGTAVMDAVFNDGKNATAALDDDVIIYHARQMKNGVPVIGQCGSTPYQCICNYTADHTCGTEGAAIAMSGNAGANCQVTTWKCPGSSGGATTACTFHNLCTGSCNNAVANSCNPTGPEAPGATGYSAGSCNGNQTWTCGGAYGGGDDHCSHPNPACASCSGNGGCGPDSYNSSDDGNGSCNAYHYWNCTSPYGYGTIGCNYYNGNCPPVDGVCDNGSYGACYVGGGFNGNVTGCGGWTTWNCSGQYGGASPGCGYYNGDCAPPPTNYQWVTVDGGYCGGGGGGSKYCDFTGTEGGTGGYVCATMGWYYVWGSGQMGGSGCNSCSYGHYNGGGNNTGGYSYTWQGTNCNSCHLLHAVECADQPQ